MRSCLTCGRGVAQGSYCTIHNPKHQYSTPTHRAAQAAASAMKGQPCPRCGRTMSSQNPPQAAHIKALTQGGRSVEGNYTVCCRICNLAERGT